MQEESISAGQFCPIISSSLKFALQWPIERLSCMELRSALIFRFEALNLGKSGMTFAEPQ